MDTQFPRLRAVGYRRVSMKEQVDGHSLAAQEASIRQFVAQQDWELTNLYTDAGHSAKKDSYRPALDRLMKDAAKGRYDIVVVDKIDRFYRHLSGLLVALDTLNQHGVTFASVKEKLDFTTPWGKLMLTVLGMLAEIYLDNLRQETIKGKLQRARSGLWNGNIPFGYCRGLCSKCKDPNGKDYCPEYGHADKSDGKILHTHPVEKWVVQKIFKLYLSGEHSDSSIAKIINADSHSLPDETRIPLRHKGIPGRVKPGSFSRDTVRGMLQRIFYTGMIPYYGRDKNGNSNKRKQPLLFDGLHPALVDAADFETVQELRKDRARVPHDRKAAKVRVYPLTGVLYCAECGGRFRGSALNSRRIYRDSNQVEHTQVCSQPSLKASYVERTLIGKLQKALLSTEVSEDILSSQAQLEEAQERRERANILFLAGEIDKTMYNREIQRCEKMRETLLFHGTDAKIASIRDVLDQLRDWQALTDLKKKRLFRLVLERAYVQGNTFVAVQPTVVFAPLLNQYFPSGKQRCNCGPDGRQQASYNPIHLFDPGTPIDEALSFLQHRHDQEPES